MADYKTYLASNILTEDRTVTYRLLSRALKVNVNIAKQMLYEFHRQQNGKKPGTIHATYLLGGKRQTEVQATNGNVKKDGEDEYMQSSPFMSSSMPQPEYETGENSTFTITLVREEDLKEVQSQYDHINSIHLYSIGPHPLKNLQVLSDATREIRQICSEEDPLDYAAKYGTIVNKNVQRRTGIKPPVPSLMPTIPATKAKPTSATAKVAPKLEPTSSRRSSSNEFFGHGREKTKPTETAASNPSSKEATPNPPALKRESSSIFKSFAKGKPKIKREDTESSAAPSPAAEDSPMAGLDDDDEEETWVPEPAKSKTDTIGSDRKSRKEREAELKKMMEDEDEEDEVIPSPTQEDEEKQVAEEKEPSVEKEVAAMASDGRRRGRRRVMKKKTVKDEEGYLVTKEEAEWESFSEDEPVEKAKPKVQASTATAKLKKAPASKTGQGSIMSFFGKK